MTKIRPNSANMFRSCCIKQLDSMLPCTCSVIDHRKCQNVERTSVTHSATPCATFLFLPHFDVICDLLLNGHMATWNLVVKYLQTATPEVLKIQILSTGLDILGQLFQPNLFIPFQMKSVFCKLRVWELWYQQL